jgi:hypothetical protein
MEPKLGTALQVAAAADHDSLIELVIEEGVDVNIEGGSDGSPLEAVC